MSRLSLPPVRTMVVAAVFATALLLGVSSLVAWASAPLMRYLWSHSNGAMAWVGIFINLISHLAAIMVAYLLFRRSTAQRAEMIEVALDFLVGYALIVLLISIYSAAGSRLTVLLSSGREVETQWPMILVGVVIPLAVAAAIFFGAGKRPSSRS